MRECRPMYSRGILHAFCDISGYHAPASICRRKRSILYSSVRFITENHQICWYLAAVVQVQLCKYFIEIGDYERESTVWGEINMLRWAFNITLHT